MNHVFVVMSEWWYEGSRDMYVNCEEQSICEVFDSEEKAVAYIRDRIKDDIDNADEFCRHQYPMQLPSASTIMESRRIVYRRGWKQKWAYFYDEYVLK